VKAREGFALVGTLWIVVAISSVAMVISTQARGIRLNAANVIERTRAEAAARAGLDQTRAWLSGDSLAMDRFPHDTTKLDSEARFAVAVHDVGARLNLNRATEEELRRFFRALRVDYGESDRLAQRIADWRDEDEMQRARGAERQTYLENGKPLPPANRPFYNVDELRGVLGIDEELMEQAAQHLTTDGSGRVNINAASEPVLLALPGITPEAVGAIMRTRMTAQAVTSLDALADGLSQGAREAMREAVPELVARTTTQTTEILVESTGWVEGSPYRASAFGLFVRSGKNTMLVEQRLQ
jgi:general secretion pathway protein K